MVLVAGAGLKRRRGLLERLRIALRVRAFKTLKLLERLGVDVAARKARYGSADYRNAGAMRPIFVQGRLRGPDRGRQGDPLQGRR